MKTKASASAVRAATDPRIKELELQIAHLQKELHVAKTGPRGRHTEDAAQYLGVSPSWLCRLRSEGGGPKFFKLGRRVLYRDVDLDAWRERHLVTSTSDAEAQRKHAAA